MVATGFNISEFKYSWRKEGWIKDGDRLVQIAGTVRQAGLTNTMSIREM